MANMIKIQAYPLQWPIERPRTKSPERSRFRKRTLGQAVDFLLSEIRLLGGLGPVISLNTQLRADGLPWARQSQPEDCGVAVYFTLEKRAMCFACDRWIKVQDNVYAVAMTIGALRGIERWGSGSMVEQAFTGFAALPQSKDPHVVLGVRPGATAAQIDQAFVLKAKAAHPDAGGSAEAFDELVKARRKLKGD